MDSIRKQFPQIEDAAWPVIEAWAVLLREWNSKINLISRKDIEYLEARHLSHCLAITNHLKLMSGTRIMDVGTGGGFPGIIMAICYPQTHFTLIDSIGKKITVVQDLADKLGLKNVEARQCRAEEVKKQRRSLWGRLSATPTSSKNTFSTSMRAMCRGRVSRGRKLVERGVCACRTPLLRSCYHYILLPIQ
jgi:16S rRNA (guanine527-N7)-methyltransferase